jgi:hypothetical protein
MADQQSTPAVSTGRWRGLKVRAVVVSLAVITALGAAATAYATLPQVDPSTVPTGILVANSRVSTPLNIKVDGGPNHVLHDGTEVFMRHVVFPAGASTGWHTHLGPVVVTVVSGSLTLYDGVDRTCAGRTIGAGQGFIDQGFGHIHLARNEGTGPADFYATYLLPPDAGDTLAVPVTGFVNPACPSVH